MMLAEETVKKPDTGFKIPTRNRPVYEGRPTQKEDMPAPDCPPGAMFGV